MDRRQSHRSGRGRGRGRGSYGSGGAGVGFGASGTDVLSRLGTVDGREDTSRGGGLRYNRYSSGDGRRDYDDNSRTYNGGGRSYSHTDRKYSGSDSSRASDSGSGEVRLQITGYKGDYDRVINFLLNFLQKNRGKNVEVLNASINESGMEVIVKHYGQAKALADLNGIRCDTQKIFIEIVSSSSSSSVTTIRSGLSITGDVSMDGDNGAGMSSIDAIRQFVATRYDSTSNYAKFDDILSDPILTNAGIPKLTENMMKVMFTMLLQQFPQVSIISFAKNSIRTTHLLSTLPGILPNIDALSIAENNITNYRDLEPLDGRKFKNLRELNLMGNPIYNRIVGTERESDYRSHIASTFPTIKVLDTKEIQTITFNTDTISVGTLPVPIKGNFIDSELTKSTIVQFLSTYYKMYDEDRNTLVDLYHPSAVFSYVNAVKKEEHPQGGFGHGTGGYGTGRGRSFDRGGRHSSERDFLAYRDGNRNLKWLNDSNRRFDLLQFGPIPIVSALLKLPNTKHPFLQDPSKMLVDSWQLPVESLGNKVPGTLLFLSVHSEFVEVPNNSSKSFDRTFMIVPADATVQTKGIPFQIVNDSLVIRPYVGKQAWGDAQDGTPLVTSGSSAASMPELPKGVPHNSASGIVVDMDSLKQQQLMSLMQQTKLKQEFAIELLVNSGWDYAAAGKLFTEYMQKGMIPPNCFEL